MRRPIYTDNYKEPKVVPKGSNSTIVVKDNIDIDNTIKSLLTLIELNSNRLDSLSTISTTVSDVLVRLCEPKEKKKWEAVVVNRSSDGKLKSIRIEEK
jgi:hypothetical protein